MADGPIDILKNKKTLEKDLDIAAYLHAIFHQVIETHNHLKLRARDLDKDSAELVNMVEAMLADLSQKYPELFPELTEIDDHDHQ